MSKIISFFTVNVLVKHRLSVAFTAALLMLFIVGFFAFQTVLQLTDDYGNVALTYEVMRELDEIVTDVSFSQTERERKQAGKNSFPPTPFLFAR